MVEYKEVLVKRMLNPTSIDLGEYVINPYNGCEYGCLYCYVRSNRNVVKRESGWGHFVDVRVNAPEILERELQEKKPGIVLLGSTTECFQPIEQTYHLTGKILTVLNRYEVSYIILTRSPLILDYLDLLSEGFCTSIYFTVNNYPGALKSVIEPMSPAFIEREKAITLLLGNNIPVIPYFSPFLPWISDVEDIFSKYGNAEHIEFEFLNLVLPATKDLTGYLCRLYPSLTTFYARLLSEKSYFRDYWETVSSKIYSLASRAGKTYRIHGHEYGAYFTNTYML